jgi:S1-C subfamily serine protease/TolA-binding protein
MARSGFSVVCCLWILLALVGEPAGALPRAGTGKEPGLGQPQSVTDAEVTSLEQEAMKCRTANDALDLYQDFLAAMQLSPKQKEKVLARQSVWQERVDKKLVRLGTEWVTLDRAKATAKAANEFIEQAFKKIKDGDFKRAKDQLDKAVKQDPSGVRADWYLGMLNSANFWNYAPAAENNFERAHKRDPENPGISNNLALSRVKMGHWGEALDAWADALRYAPEAPDTVHNLGRFVKEAGAGRIRIGEAQVKRARKMYDKALADKKGPASNEKVGWLYSPLSLSVDERARSESLSIADDDPKEGEKAKAKPTVTKTLFGSGTGFVVSPGYVLSNRHVAKGGTSFGLFQPGENATERPASVVAISDDLDLALFKSEELTAPEVTLNVEPPRRASDILVLGFPFGEALGSSIKAVRGTVFGFNDDAKRKIMMYEASTNPGNSGGPVCDNSGRVVAVHFAGLNLAAVERGAGKLGMGIPIEAAMPFLTNSLPDLKAGNAGEKLEWPEIDQRISQSVVLIKLYVENLPMVQKSPTSKATNVFEDCTCTACKGRAKVACPVKGCFKGSIAQFETSYSVNGVGAGAQVLQWSTPRNRACTGCRGAGVVDCQHCANGFDPALK